MCRGISKSIKPSSVAFRTLSPFLFACFFVRLPHFLFDYCLVFMFRLAFSPFLIEELTRRLSRTAEAKCYSIRVAGRKQQCDFKVCAVLSKKEVVQPKLKGRKPKKELERKKNKLDPAEHSGRKHRRRRRGFTLTTRQSILWGVNNQEKYRMRQRRKRTKERLQ